MAVVENPFELVEAKLAAPFTRPGTATKADLVARLCSATVPLTAVVAPAGYGKTTLLANWAKADPRPFAWLALDGRDDNDAAAFLRYIAAAIHRVEPLPPEVFDSLAGAGGSAQATRVGRVGAALAACGRPMVLALDDLHTISDHTCLDVLAELLAYVPAGSQIAISSREVPDLSLARWRAQGRVHEIGLHDLRLEEQEAELLLGTAGVELEANELSELTKRTEGWPAGLYLAALSLRSGSTSAAAAALFGGDDRFVSEYFRDELLTRLPAAEATFLTHTSILDRMSAGLCDAVLQETGSTQKLDTLARVNGFVVPLDRRGEWFRYHHLFGQLLRSELERSEPDLVRELNARAMRWCVANDLLEAAVTHGQAAEEKDTVARLVEALALPLYRDGRMSTVNEWIGWFSDDDLTRYPALAVYAAWFRLLAGRPDEVERWLELADGATSTIPISDGSSTIEPWAALLRAHMMQDGIEAAIADADLAIAQLPPESGWITSALQIRGVLHALSGDLDRATDDLTLTIERGPALGTEDDVFTAQAQLALLAIRQGAWSQAGQWARAAQALVEEMGLADYPVSATTHVATARVALHEARQDEARAALGRAHRLRPLLDHGMPWLTVQVGLELTRVHLALAEATAARTILGETERVLKLRPDLGFLVDDAQELRERVDATAGAAGAWAMSLTRAELRLLPYLATHLTFPEIAKRLFISRNTVKTEAVSIYRKFGASSRGQAIERAVEVGLLESSLFPPRANLTQEV